MAAKPENAGNDGGAKAPPSSFRAGFVPITGLPNAGKSTLMNALCGARLSIISEKPQTKEGWINGAFFVLEPEVFDFIEGDSTHFEKEPLERLAANGQLMAYRPTSFWQCMDTLREKKYLEDLWEKEKAPWKTWEDQDAGISYGTRRVYRDGVGSAVVERGA